MKNFRKHNGSQVHKSPVHPNLLNEPIEILLEGGVTKKTWSCTVIWKWENEYPIEGDVIYWKFVNKEH